MNTLEYSREEVVEALKDDVCRVVFTKKNGEQRTMNCTLKNDILESELSNYERSNDSKKSNDEIITVWEIDVGWRSFRVDSILDVSKWKDRVKWIDEMVSEAENLGLYNYADKSR